MHKRSCFHYKSQARDKTNGSGQQLKLNSRYTHTPIDTQMFTNIEEQGNGYLGQQVLLMAPLITTSCISSALSATSTIESQASKNNNEKQN